MNVSPSTSRLWDIPSLVLWTGFFVTGLVPELVFYYLRSVSGVVSQTAFVNSSSVITFGFAIYLGLFSYRRCLDSPVSPSEAAGKGVQVGVLALVAFLEIPRPSGAYETTTLLFEFLHYRDIAQHEGRRAVLLVGSAKIVAWWYLYSLMVRYYVFGKKRTFAQTLSFFPSAYRRKDQ